MWPFVIDVRELKQSTKNQLDFVAIADSSVEVGGDQNGFHSWPTSYPGLLRFHLGDCGPLNKGGPFHTSEDNIMEQR
jgi:hypothetical protein